MFGVSNVSKLQAKEIDQLTKDNGGLLKPEVVVQFARNSKTALHSAFEWSDSKAAEGYRLWQARQVIVSVQMLERKTGKPIQVMVSLESDRRNGGGYRRLSQVLSQKKLREQLLQQAWRDFQYWKEKYEKLKELAPLFLLASRIETTNSTKGKQK